MPSTPSEQSPLDALITLKSQYERSLSEAETQVSHLREQLSHVNALLLNQLVPPQAPIKSAEPALTLEEADAQVERLALAPAATEAPAVDTPKTKASSRKTKAAPEPTPAAPESGKRSPRPLLPAYAGLTRVEAITQLLQTTPGQDVTADQISEGLFGKLSAADHKAERKSLNTQLSKGQSQKLWQKGTALGTYTIGAPTTSESVQSTTAPDTKAEPPANPPETTAAKRKSLTVLPAYAGLTKREAIAQVLQQYSGEILHQDTIIKTLYGDLSLEDLKKERVRIKTTLLTGVTDGKWQKATAPSSYFLGEAKAKGSGRKSKPQTTKAEADITIAPIEPPTLETTPAAAKKRDSLTVLPAFEGMTKLDAIAKVLGQNLGEVLHQDTIIQMLYGDLSLEELKKERVRMDTLLRNGVKNNKWKKAPVPASYVLEATAAGAKAKRPGRKPDPTKEPKPQPEPVVEAAIAPASTEVPAIKAKAAKAKPGRKPAVGKAKTSKSKRSEAELVEILQKADIQI